jgi:Spy/CpxP family protein refolding chaperone
LGEELTVNPSDWKFNHQIVSNVGLGFGDNEKLLASVGQLLNINLQLGQTGSPLIDQKKMYNILSRLVKGLGLPDVAEFYNDPEKPQELLMAENEILSNNNAQLQQMVQQLQNPLREAEEIKAQAKLIEAESRKEVDIAKAIASQQEAIAKLAEDQRQFNIKTAQDAAQFQQDLAARLTKMELESGQDVPGAQV